MIDAPLKTWVLCWIPSPDRNDQEIHYWGGKGSGRWETDIAQATHFATIGAAKAKMTANRKSMTGRGWWNFTDEDRMFIGQIDTIIQINKTGIEG